MIIIGAGYIGCEFAGAFNQFGCEVTMVEMQEQVIPALDTEISKRLAQMMKAKGIKIFLNSKILPEKSESP